MTLNIDLTAVWLITAGSLVGGCQCLDVVYCPHLRGEDAAIMFLYNVVNHPPNRRCCKSVEGGLITDLRSSRISRSVERQFVADVSEQHIGPIFKYQ
jgi:hypothetical protein